MLLWEEEHWGGSWRGYDGGFVAAHVVPSSGGRWLPVVRNDALDVTCGTLEEAKAAAEAAHALLPPPVPYKARERYGRRLPNAPIRVPHPGEHTKRPQ